MNKVLSIDRFRVKVLKFPTFFPTFSAPCSYFLLQIMRNKKARLIGESGFVAPTGVEPVTHGFSVRCSTN